MQPKPENSHEKKYAEFLEGLAIYMERLRQPRAPKAANDNAREPEPLLAFRGGPPSAGLGTNWSLTPSGTYSFDSENDTDEAGYQVETLHEMAPTPNAIMRGLQGVEFKQMAHAKVGGGGHIELIPISGDVEYGTHIDDEGKEHCVVIRLGRWKFSDGTQTEKGRKRKPGCRTKTIEAPIKLPVGAMRETREKATSPRGGEGSYAGSKPYFEEILGAKYDYKPGGKRRGGKSRSAEESRALLAEAIANTPVMPAIKKCPPGIASGSNYRPRDLFIGLQKTTCAGGGAMNWQELGEAIEERKAWFRWVDELKDEDRRAIDAAMNARNYADVGKALGYDGDYAGKAGKRLLFAANDNAQKILKKSA
ncbi:hypothetical protein [Chelativorans sp. AA-79]|uniref:hypothetical protein n=1 Tax=Chelativorans sp. AA-79 TaxID=3028735 RepID=UPI0023F8FF71|nr:hypothetical protein [Chelativorans sp. AA-79]WEX07384.1 hypothetical protein PVE73_14765 [Chelativorans sp. AA-79]